MELKVKPVLTYGVYQRREATSWRPWGGLQTEEDAKKEARRIEEELKSLSSSASFPLEVLPLSALRTSDDVSLIKKELSSSDITLIYAAGGDKKVLETLVSCSRWSLIFVRHKSGPL
ncbi:sugar isomerase, partial [candidate division KSB1 bacterium]